MEPVDPIDARLLQALGEEPRATVVALAERLGLARNTVQSRLARLERRGVLGDFGRRIDPAALGHPLRAYVTTRVDQRRLGEVTTALARIPEVVEDESTGLLVPPGDVSALAEAIDRLLADPELRSAMCGAALQRSADYAWPAIAASHEQTAAEERRDDTF